MNRRGFLKLGARTGLAGASMPLWMRLAGASAYGQSANSYKAIVCITLEGGNDGNNTIVPMDAASYTQYASLRQGLALSQASLNQVQTSTGGVYGFHNSLKNVSSLFTSGNASIIANCGPMDQPLTKTLLQQNANLLPQLFGSHPVAVAQWESATTDAAPSTGWGGRIADQVSNLSGQLPPVVSLSGVSTFTVGETSQAVSVVQTAVGGGALPSQFQQSTMNLAEIDAQSTNALIQQAAQSRQTALNLQTVLNQGLLAGANIKTPFPTSTLGQDLLNIAKIINGRSSTEASRQIFYCNTGPYDTHGNQLGIHASLLSDFDASIGAFVAALQEIGMLQDVLVLTLSDFGRTMESNSSAGSDHGWGNQQFVFGGGIQGRKIFGSLPDLDLGGSQDWTGQGVWIPGIATQQIAASAASWFGLSSSQISSIFPNLAAFSSTPFSLT